MWARFLLGVLLALILLDSKAGLFTVRLKRERYQEP